MTRSSARLLSILFLTALLGACASRRPAPIVFVAFDQELNAVATLHNSHQYDALKTHFAKGASIRLPATPRSGSIDAYVTALASDPYTISFSNTDIVYSLPGRATTRSDITINAPGKFNLKQNATIDWVLEDGYWKISRIAVAEWSPLIGTWRRNGLKDEGSLELRLLPGGTYQIYVADDHTMPAFRGQYVLEGNRITLTDTSSYDGKLYQPVPGTYIFLRTTNGVNFRKVDEQNSWRTDRFDGDWMASK